MPGWAQAAAAVLVLGVAAGAANLQVSVRSRPGFSVRTGWLSAGARRLHRRTRRRDRDLDGARQDDAPWRADLVALEQQLRAEFRAAPSVPRSRAAAPRRRQRRARRSD